MTKRKSHSYPKEHRPITRLQDRDVWLYCLRTCEDNGTIHQTTKKIHDAMLPEADIPARSIQRSLRSLLKTSYLIEVEPRDQNPETQRWVQAKYRVIKEVLQNGLLKFGGKSAKIEKVPHA
jgi:hypothetical protein